MFKKTISAATLIAFVAFDWACLSHSVRKEPVSSVMGQDVAILGVIKTSGQFVYFAKDKPGRIVGNEICETWTGEYSIPLWNVKSFQQTKDGVIYEIVTKNGRTYANITGKKGWNNIVILDPERSAISIPLGEVQMVYVQRVNPSGSVIAIVAETAFVAFGLLALVALVKSSCPFIYSYDAGAYVFDAEPYGGATSRGLKRTEWCSLEHLKPVRGEFRLKITNEVDETQHTDELKLVTVDHPHGLRVIPDEAGVFHTFSRLEPPLSARDQKGRDITPYVQANDWVFWQSRLDGKDPDKNEDLRDELVFEFPKPLMAKRAKLLFNGCNTLWASHMVKRFLELYGDGVKDYYAAIDSQGPFYWTLIDWNLREELYRLRILAETPKGWISLGTLVGGGPFASEDRAYPVDLTNIPGEILRLKVAPPAGFWMINYLALDYSDDVSVSVTELEPARAVDSRGRDIRPLLARTDNVFYDAPRTGDSADMMFLVPATSAGLGRSLFCKASGYYDLHLTSVGRPRWDILGRLASEPGFAVSYALREYQKWIAEHPLPSTQEAR